MSATIPILSSKPAAPVADDDDALRAQIGALVREYGDRRTTPAFEPGVTAVPPSGKVIGAPEMMSMVDAALDGWLTTGRFNALFEERLAAYVGVTRAMTVNSGSSANLVAFTALTSPLLGDRAIRPGDEVITVAAGFPTTVNPVLQNGAVPVFVDVDIPTYNIDVGRLEAARSERTRAVMIAHTLGNPFDVGAVVAFCERHDLWLVEDCCDALGATFGGRKVGTFGDLATLSFYPAHHITMGEGGAVLTSDPLLARAAESIRDWGRDCWCAPGNDNTCGKRFCWKHGDLPYGYDHKYTYSHLGYNLKISDMQAACALAQMDRLDGFVAARRANFAFLHRRLAACAEFVELPEATPRSDPSWFGFPITLRDAAATRRVDLLTYLDERKIGTRLLFSGNLTRQPYMQGRTWRVAGDLANADRIMNDTFWIGVYPGLDDTMLEYMASSIERFFKWVLMEARSLTGLDPRDLADVLAQTTRLHSKLLGARIVVTGATGWFGTWLLDALVALDRVAGLGLRVVAVSRAPEAFARRWPTLYRAPEIDWIAADVRDPTLAVPGRVTHVIHAATDSHATTDDATLKETIVEGTRNLAGIAGHQAGVRMLFVSSGAVYGRQPAGMQRIAEPYRGSLVATDAYANGKRDAEDWLSSAAGPLGVHATIARCFAFVGPHMRFDAHFAIGNFIRDASAGRTVEIDGDGTPSRSYLYMTDLVAWLLAILVDGRPGRAYNVGSPHAITIEALARRCADVAVSAAGVRVRHRSSGGRDYVPDVGRIVDELQVGMTVPLDEAIARTLRWKRARAESDAATVLHGAEA